MSFYAILKSISLSISLTFIVITQQIFAPSLNPIVTTPLMQIRGQWKASYLGRSYKSFEGIPYGQPPINELRFKPPQPIVTPLNGTIDATKEPNKCIQYDYETSQVVGVEDCLYLNIYVPKYKRQSVLLPVIVWFHEGAFQRGAGTYTKAKYLMDRDVIFVTLNYRLGLFGFLSTGDEVVSGNMGLKDQNLALRWVNENIQYFGGDHRKISLFGASAGAASVHYHYLSKSSTGLFQSGVSFSGTSLSLWAFDPKPMKSTQLLAEAVGCDTENSEILVKCLKSLSADKLVIGVEQILKSAVVYYALFVPVAEKNASNYFINCSPEEILRNGNVNDVPWTSGVLSDDGAQVMLALASNNKTRLSFESEWENAAINLFLLDRTLPANKHVVAAREARKHYVGNKSLRNDNGQIIRGWIDMRSDRSFYTILEKATKLQAKANKSPVYSYMYGYRSNESLVDYVPGNNTNFGPTHLDDIFLVLENEFIDPTKTVKDRAMLEIMLDFWYSVAATGTPKLSGRIDLPTVEPNSTAFEFLKINGPGDYTLRSSDDFGQKKFWSSLGFDLRV